MKIITVKNVDDVYKIYGYSILTAIARTELVIHNQYEIHEGKKKVRLVLKS